MATKPPTACASPPTATCTPQEIRRHPARILRAGRRGGRCAAAVRRPDRLRHCRGSAGAGRGTDGRQFPSSPCSATTTTSPASRRCPKPTQAGVRVLDGEACEIHGVGIAGRQGFCRRLRARRARAWGEPAIKQFVQGGVNEALKLESALAKLRTPHRIALLHYAPDRRHGAGRAARDLSVPGHQPARGAADALPGQRRVPRPRAPRRSGGPHGQRQPVYNVAKPLLRAPGPTGLRFRVLELPREAGVASS